MKRREFVCRRLDARAVVAPRCVSALALALVLVTGTRATAVEVFMPCETLIVKMDKINPHAAIFKLLCRPTAGLFPIPSGVNSPLENGVGASLYVRDLVSGLEAGRSLPSANWTGLGEPPGVEGYRYRESNSLGCRSLRLDAEHLKLKCSISVPLNFLPATGDFGLLLYFFGPSPGSEHQLCAQVGGLEYRNDELLLKRKGAAAPSECVGP